MVAILCAAAKISREIEPRGKWSMNLETEVAELLEDSEAQYLCDRVSDLADIPDTPYGAGVTNSSHYHCF